MLEQTNAILRGRLPEGLFVPSFLAIVEGHTLRWCNAGHPSPQLLRSDGATSALGTTGLPLGVDDHASTRSSSARLAEGDVLVAATDGLWQGAARASSSATPACRTCSSSTAARSAPTRSSAACATRPSAGARPPR